jgi:hypothetical protein
MREICASEKARFSLGIHFFIDLHAPMLYTEITRIQAPFEKSGNGISC